MRIGAIRVVIAMTVGSPPYLPPRPRLSFIVMMLWAA